MIRKLAKYENATTPMYLNIGCGRRYHHAWVNLDLESNDPAVIRHDVTHGLPFESQSFHAVYHSHVLEHLKPKQGAELISECFRVLKPGGVLRIVVPDLESITKLYLKTHGEACDGDPSAQVNYHWMKLELIDQMVRENSGGQMGRYMARQDLENKEFVRSRVGDEFSICQSPDAGNSAGPSIWSRLAHATQKMRIQIVRHMIRWALGVEAQSAFDVGMFRNQGEVHQWMYDRFSLNALCAEAGFQQFQVCRADESRIENYAQFELDSVDSHVRKPDSIFVECQKPAAANRHSQAA